MPQATNIIKNPVKRDGTSQKQRQLPALDPSFIKIDERTLEDFLVFAQEYSKRVLFYNTDNKEHGTWESFWGSDPTLIIAAIEKTNPLPAKTAYEEILSREPSVEGFHALVILSLDIVRKIEYWYNNLLTGSNLKVEIKRYIQANFQGFLEQLATYEKGASTLFEDYPGIDDDNYKGFSNEWAFNVNDLDGIEFDPSLFRPEVPINEENPAKCFENFTTEEQLTAAYPGLKDLFTTAYNVYFQIIQVAPEHFKESLTRKDHPAHLALFISFLMLYSQVQDDLNRITQRHLDFYYKNVLGLQSKEAVPDKVHLFFELAKNRLEHSLDGGVRFKAGKDILGNDMYFSLDKSTVVNIATVESLRTIFLPTSLTGDLKKVTGIHAAPVANSADGLGEEIKDEEKPSWATVGNDTMPIANLGFVIASNELALAEGIRKVTLDIHTKNDVVLSGEPFNILLSGEKDWISADYTLNDTTQSNPSLPGKGFRLQFTLQPESPAVVPFDAETFKEDLGTDLPLMKILLQNSLQDGVLNYEKLRNLKIEKIVLSVDVSGVQQIMAFNDEGTIITDKPFMPFTTNPKKGSSFYVGNAEAFQKSLEEVKLNLHWEQVPNDLELYYAGFDGTSGLTHASHQVEFFSIGSKEYTSDLSPQGIFDPLIDDFTTDSGEFSDRKVELTLAQSDSMPLAYLLPTDEADNYGQDSKEGFLRFDLQRDFEHDQYSNVLSRQILAVSKFPVRIIGAWYDTGTGIKKATADDPADISSWEVIIPKTPYTPSLKSITLSYTSSASTNVSADAGVITFLHLHPFADTYQNFDGVNGVPLVPQFGGRVKQLPSLSLVSNALSITAPTDNQVILLEEAALLIGLNGLKPSQSLSILFQLAENTANAEIPKSQVYWYYLADNEWLPFEEYQVVSDTTDGLLTSGIIEFAIPDGINTQNTILPNNLHWLKAAVTEYPDSISESINVHTQAAGATFEDNENDLSHLLAPLPAETISKLENDDAAVKGINQLYDSFGGLPAEDSLNFYTRVSERLRHKGRAITQYDYERLVLEAYPSIYKVKCINHTDGDHNLSPGHVLISVVPDFSKLKAVDRRQPKVSLAQLEKIKRFIDDRNTCFVSDSVTTLHVLNPVYEMIDLDFSVRFTPDITAVDFYLRKLKEDIVTFLSPWAIDDAAEINFGGKVFKSSILHFVEKQSYVDFVMNFKMMHDGSTEDTNIIEAGTPRSILVPVLEENMNIQHISTEDYCKMDNRVTKQALGYQSLDETILGA